MRLSLIASPLSALLLVACAMPVEQTPMPAPAASGKCNAAPARAYIGQVATDAVVGKAKAASGADIARVLRSGDIVTMEYRADRLNINVDDKRVIIELTCG